MQEGAKFPKDRRIAKLEDREKRAENSGEDEVFPSIIPQPGPAPMARTTESSVLYSMSWVPNMEAWSAPRD